MVVVVFQAFGTNKAGVVSRGFFETAKPAPKKTTSDGGAAPMAENSAAAPAQDLNDKGEVVTSAAVRVHRAFVVMSCAAYGVIGVSVFCSWFERAMSCRRLTQCVVVA